MKFIAIAVVIVALAVSAVHSGLVPLISTGGLLVQAPLSYTAQTVDLNGLQATVVAGQPARLVAVEGGVLGQVINAADGTIQVVATPSAAIQLATGPAGIQWAGVPTGTVQIAGAPAAVQVATVAAAVPAAVPAAVQLEPAVVPVVQAEG